MSDQIDLFAPADTPDLEWRKKHLGGRYALWTLFYKGLETGHSITPAGYEDDQAKPWTGSIFTRKDAKARAFATREEAQAEAERLFLDPPSYVYPPDEWHARETERLRRLEAGEDEWDLPFVEDEEEPDFVPAPASDPPSDPFYQGPRRCAFYRPMEPARRGRPARFVILDGPHRKRFCGDSCRGAAEYAARTLSGWQRSDDRWRRWKDLPGNQAVPTTRYRSSARPDLDWSKSEYHRDYYAMRAQQEREWVGRRRR